MDIQTALKITGTGMTGLGSILLAWRVKSILQWVVHCIVAHEVSIEQLQRVANNQPQTQSVIIGTPIHLLETQDKIGFILLVGGLLLLGVGMLLNMSAYLVAL